MLVSRKHKQLIMKLNNPDQVLTVTKGAKRSKKFGNIVYVPHNPENVATLRAIGFKKTPSSVSYDYNWPGRFIPFDHQAATVDFLTGHKRAFNLSGIGAGKTNGAAWSADFLMNKGAVKRCLIISPLSTLERVWGDTLWADMHHRKFAVLHGTADRRRKLFADKSFDFYIINYDGFGTIAQEFKTRKDINCVILDESDFIKDPSTDRFKLLNACIQANNPEYLWLQTATPTPNNPYDAWAQAKLAGTNQGCTFSAFKDMTMQKISTFRWVPRTDWEKKVQLILSPAIRFKTSECIDLPPVTYHTRQAELTAEQKRLLKELKRDCAADIGSATINAVNEADLQNKFLQIICGFAYHKLEDEDTRETIRIDPGPRLKVLDEILEKTTEGKVIVFVPYVELIHILREHLEKKYTVEVVDGSVSKNKRNEIFRAFQDDKNPHILLAHPRTMSHGLTLTSAATVIWYAPYPSNGTYEQANGRINRPSQVRTMNIFHIEASDLEKRIFEKLRNRQALQGSLLDYIKLQGI